MTKLVSSYKDAPYIGRSKLVVFVKSSTIMFRKRAKLSTSDDEMSPNKNLLEACQSGNANGVRKILSDKYRLKNELNLRDNHNWTPLHHAVNSDNLQCVQLLLNQQNIDVRAESFEGWTALFLACQKPLMANSVEIAKELLQKDPELVFYVNNEMESVLQAAVENFNFEMVKLLVETGFPINWTDLDDETALHIAVRVNSEEIIEYLLYSNCDPTIKNVFVLNPLELHIALGNDFNREILDLFLDFYPVDDFITLIIQCLAHQNYETFSYLSEKFYNKNNSKSYFINILMKSFPIKDWCRRESSSITTTLLTVYAIMHEEIATIDSLSNTRLAPHDFKWNDLYFILCKIYNDQGFDVFMELLSEIMSKGFDFTKALTTIYMQKGCLSIQKILIHYNFLGSTKQFTKHNFTVKKFNKFIGTLLKMDVFSADCILDCLYDYFDPDHLICVESLLYLLSKFRTTKIYLSDEYLTDESYFYDWSPSRTFCRKFKNVKQINPEIIKLYEMYGSRNYPKIIKKIDSSVVLIPSLKSLCRFVILENLDRKTVEKKEYSQLLLPESLNKFIKFDYS